MRKKTRASGCCRLASRYWRIAGVVPRAAVAGALTVGVIVPDGSIVEAGSEPRPMWILALDTSTREGSVAVARDGGVVATANGDPSRTHGERLPGDLLALAGDAGVTLSAVDLFAVSSGPGSFTSLRVGLATIQALALVHGRSVIPVSTLEALARTPGAGDLVLAWMDGGRRDVFAALYDRAAAACLAGPRVGPPAEILDAWMPRLADRRVDVVGDGVTATRGHCSRSGWGRRPSWCTLHRRSRRRSRKSRSNAATRRSRPMPSSRCTSGVPTPCWPANPLDVDSGETVPYRRWRHQPVDSMQRDQEAT